MNKEKNLDLLEQHDTELYSRNSENSDITCPSCSENNVINDIVEGAEIELDLKEELIGILKDLAEKLEMSPSEVITQILLEYYPQMFEKYTKDITAIVEVDYLIRLWLKILGIADTNIQLIIDGILEIFG
jgi:hypothetical protein